VSVKILENLRKAVLEYDNEQAVSLARKISKRRRLKLMEKQFKVVLIALLR
jgi:hypothetical protein